jgi:subtilisin family serine protease
LTREQVAYIEKDTVVYALDMPTADVMARGEEERAVLAEKALTTQTGAPWGLGRISHRAKGSTSYIYDTTAGAGVTVYVVDTGVYTSHTQFATGRATMGANYISGSAVRILFIPQNCPRIHTDPQNRTPTKTATARTAPAPSPAPPTASPKPPKSSASKSSTHPAPAPTAA